MVGRDACAWMKVWGGGQEPVLGSGLRGCGCGLELHGGVHVTTGDMPVTGALWPGRAMWGKQDGPRQSPGQGGSGTFCSWAHGPSDQHTAAAIKSTTHPETQQQRGAGHLGPAVWVQVQQRSPSRLRSQSRSVWTHLSRWPRRARLWLAAECPPDAPHHPAEGLPPAQPPRQTSQGGSVSTGHGWKVRQFLEAVLCSQLLQPEAPQARRLPSSHV